MSKENKEDKKDKELIDLVFSALFSEINSSEENPFDTLFLDENSLEDVFRKRSDYPTAKDIEKGYSEMSDSSIYKDLVSNTLKGIKHYENNKKEMVNHPDHYNKSEIETLEKFMLINHDRPEKIMGALEFNIIKYSDRVGIKDATIEGIKEDNSKINFYYELYELLFPEATSFIDLYRVWKKSKK